jgi:hypothetical protein
MFVNNWFPIAVFDKKKDAVALLKKEGFKYNKKEDFYYKGREQYILTKIIRNKL